jgi:hypothetical protein
MWLVYCLCSLELLFDQPKPYEETPMSKTLGQFVWYEGTPQALCARPR